MLMKLILFDIDGTLIWPDGAGRAAMSRALTEVFGVTGPADSLPMAGKTDWQIITELLTATGLSQSSIEANLPQCFKAVARHTAQTTRERRIRVCPGIPPLLARLSAGPNAILGLLTGNLATTAPIKLRAANLNPAFFCVGAYGDDGLNRSQLPAVAIARAQALTSRTFLGKDVIIIGDTPADVRCGKHLGVTAIGVATGHYPQESLSAAGADYVFPDLADTEMVIQTIL
jgi:phosphoglycolate phosphatase-like HAD superfamily hydrolase